MAIMVTRQFANKATRSLVNSLVSPDKLRHPRSDAYSAQHVLLYKQQIWCGGAYLDCYQLAD